MVQSRFSKVKTIPGISTEKTSPTTTNFADGISTYKPNDTMKSSELRLAQDARFDRIGEYKTRKGFKKLSEPIGKRVLTTNISEDVENTLLSEVQPYTFTATEDTPIYSIAIKIRRTSEEYAVPMLVLSVEDEKIATSCINPDEITDEYSIHEVIFMNTPNIFDGESVSISIATQDGRAGDFVVETLEDGTLEAGVFTCTEGAVTNIFEANIEDVKTILFTQNATLYRMDNTGVVTKIRDLPEGTTKVRFNQDLNQVRYVDGKEGPRLLNPADNWSDTAISTTDLETETDLQIKTSNIMDGISDNMVYFDAETNTQAVWTYPYGYAYAKATM